MVPIYESDVAEERWEKSRWNHYELWEKVEQKLRRKSRLWIVATAVVFLLLSSLPILHDRIPKWRALSAVRELAQQMNRAKRRAAVEHQAFRIRFSGAGSIAYQIEPVAHCSDSAASGPAIASGSLLPPPQNAEFTLLSHVQGEAANIPGLVEEFCYDPLVGNASALRGQDVAGFGILPSSDLSSGRMDRLSVLLISGSSAELSFE